MTRFRSIAAFLGMMVMTAFAVIVPIEHGRIVFGLVCLVPSLTAIAWAIVRGDPHD